MARHPKDWWNKARHFWGKPMGFAYEIWGKECASDPTLVLLARLPYYSAYDADEAERLRQEWTTNGYIDVEVRQSK